MNWHFSKEDDLEKSDFIIYNTCLVRETAELKVYGQLGALNNLSRKKPEMMIAVGGNGTVVAYKDLGLVTQVFNESTLSALQGDVAVGHCRYITLPGRQSTFVKDLCDQT